MFDLGHLEIHLFDIGGVRNKRLKWYYVRDMEHAFIFVADTSGYAKCLMEDMTKNGADEQFRLFRSHMNSLYTDEKPMILAVTKIDHLKESYGHQLHVSRTAYEGSWAVLAIGNKGKKTYHHYLSPIHAQQASNLRSSKHLKGILD
jgi:hypothetical protein